MSTSTSGFSSSKQCVGLALGSKMMRVLVSVNPDPPSLRESTLVPHGLDLDAENSPDLNFTVVLFRLGKMLQAQQFGQFL